MERCSAVGTGSGERWQQGAGGPRAACGHGKRRGRGRRDRGVKWGRSFLGAADVGIKRRNGLPRASRSGRPFERPSVSRDNGQYQSFHHKRPPIWNRRSTQANKTENFGTIEIELPSSIQPHYLRTLLCNKISHALISTP